jgi:hypothetical protein
LFIQLNPPLPVDVADRGPGQAIAVIDYGPEHHMIWVTALDASGEIWCAPNPRVRVQSNWTLGRKSALDRSHGPSVKVADACACHEDAAVGIA